MPGRTARCTSGIWCRLPLQERSSARAWPAADPAGRLARRAPAVVLAGALTIAGWLPGGRVGARPKCGLGPQRRRSRRSPTSSTRWSRLLGSAEFLDSLGASAGRRTAGLALAVVIGVPLGTLMGRWRTLYTLVDPLLVVGYPVPKAALILLFALWWGGRRHIARGDRRGRLPDPDRDLVVPRRERRGAATAVVGAGARDPPRTAVAAGVILVDRRRSRRSCPACASRSRSRSSRCSRPSCSSAGRGSGRSCSPRWTTGRPSASSR